MNTGTARLSPSADSPFHTAWDGINGRDKESESIDKKAISLLFIRKA
jgi:hypothetical protein